MLRLRRIRVSKKFEFRSFNNGGFETRGFVHTIHEEPFVIFPAPEESREMKDVTPEVKLLEIKDE